MTERDEGLYRDGKCLVLYRLAPRFPLRCVMTNEPVDRLGYRVSERLPSKPELARTGADLAVKLLQLLPLGPIFGMVPKLVDAALQQHDKNDLEFDVGLCAGRRRNRWIQNVIIFAGVLLGIILAPLVMIGYEQWIDPRLITAVERGATFLIGINGAIGFIFLVTAFAMRVFPTVEFHVQNVWGDFVWLTGAGDAFLDSLPAWNPRNEQPGAG